MSDTSCKTKHKKCCRGPRGFRGPRGPPGPFMPGTEQFPSVYVFNSDGDRLSNGEWLQVKGKTSQLFHAQYIIPRNGKLRNLYVEIDEAVSGNEDAIFTVYINGNPANGGSFAATVFDPPNGTKASNTSSSATVNAGDLLSIQYESSSPGSVDRRAIASIELF